IPRQGDKNKHEKQIGQLVDECTPERFERVDDEAQKFLGDGPRPDELAEYVSQIEIDCEKSDDDPGYFREKEKNGFNPARLNNVLRTDAHRPDPPVNCLADLSHNPGDDVESHKENDGSNQRPQDAAEYP